MPRTIQGSIATIWRGRQRYVKAELQQAILAIESKFIEQQMSIR